MVYAEHGTTRSSFNGNFGPINNEQNEQLVNRGSSELISIAPIDRMQDILAIAAAPTREQKHALALSRARAQGGLDAKIERKHRTWTRRAFADLLSKTKLSESFLETISELRKFSPTSRELLKLETRLKKVDSRIATLQDAVVEARIRPESYQLQPVPVFEPSEPEISDFQPADEDEDDEVEAAFRNEPDQSQSSVDFDSSDVTLISDSQTVEPVRNHEEERCDRVAVRGFLTRTRDALSSLTGRKILAAQSTRGQSPVEKPVSMDQNNQPESKRRGIFSGLVDAVRKFPPLIGVYSPNGDPSKEKAVIRIYPDKVEVINTNEQRALVPVTSNDIDYVSQTASDNWENAGVSKQGRKLRSTLLRVVGLSALFTTIGGLAAFLTQAVVAPEATQSQLNALLGMNKPGITGQPRVTTFSQTVLNRLYVEGTEPFIRPQFKSPEVTAASPTRSDRVLNRLFVEGVEPGKAAPVKQPKSAPAKAARSVPPAVRDDHRLEQTGSVKVEPTVNRASETATVRIFDRRLVEPGEDSWTIIKGTITKESVWINDLDNNRVDQADVVAGQIVRFLRERGETPELIMPGDNFDALVAKLTQDQKQIIMDTLNTTSVIDYQTRVEPRFNAMVRELEDNKVTNE